MSTCVFAALGHMADCTSLTDFIQSLAPAHYEARLLKINVDNCPFLVTRLKVQVLPCIIAFVDGIGVDRVIGFEGLGRTPDSFTTRDLEARLIRANVLTRSKVGEEEEAQRVARKRDINNDENDDDWD
jgi:thioredoxin-like negative regulator of GroEL